MKWTAELASFSLSIKSGCKQNGVWVVVDESIEGILSLFDSLGICLPGVTEALPSIDLGGLDLL